MKPTARETQHGHGILLVKDHISEKLQVEQTERSNAQLQVAAE